ncbi:hypothetical protein AVM71_12780 [Piscirickettsia salmonis]|nr:hypothetical protein AVM71_12780 [Piscirickettsia salmonis]
MPLKIDQIADVDDQGVRYKQSAPTLHFQLDGKEFKLHPLEMPLYFGDITDKKHFNFLALAASKLGEYVRHGLETYPEGEEDQKRRERKLAATLETQQALMALAPLLKLNRYSQCTGTELEQALQQVRDEINRIYPISDQGSQNYEINKALKEIIDHRLDKIQQAAAQKQDPVDISPLHLYPHVVDLSEALLEGLQEKSNLEYDRRDTRTVHTDDLYESIQHAKVPPRDPFNQRRGHGETLNDSNFGLFHQPSSKTAQTEERIAADEQAGVKEEPEYYFDPAHYDMNSAGIAKYCDLLSQPKFEVQKPIAIAAAADSEEHTTQTSAISLASETHVDKEERLSLAEQLKKRRANPTVTKKAAKKERYFDTNRAGSNDTLFKGPAAGAIAGALIGSAVPGLGTAVGAAIGAGIGWAASSIHHGASLKGVTRVSRAIQAATALPNYLLASLESGIRPLVRLGQDFARAFSTPDQRAYRARIVLELDLPDKNQEESLPTDNTTSIPVPAPTQLTLDMGESLSSIFVSIAAFTKGVADPLSSRFASNPTLGLFLQFAFAGTLGAGTALQAVGASHLNSAQATFLHLYNGVGNTFSGSTGPLAQGWAWLAPGKVAELLIADPLHCLATSNFRQSELFGHIARKIEAASDDPAQNAAAVAAKQALATAFTIALVGGAAHLAAPYLGEALKLVGMPPDMGSNEFGRLWNDILLLTKGSAIATSMMLFHNKPESVVRNTNEILNDILESYAKRDCEEDGQQAVREILTNLRTLHTLSPEDYASLRPEKQREVQDCYNALKEVFGVELMHSLIPGEKVGIRPPAPANLLGRVLSWPVSVVSGAGRVIGDICTLSPGKSLNRLAGSLTNAASGLLTFGAVLKNLVSRVISKPWRANVLTRQVAKRLPGFGGNEQEVADNLRAKYDNQRPERNWLLSPLKSWSRFQHWFQRGLTNLMHLCTARAMAGKNTLPKSPGLVEAELKAQGIEVSDGHPVFQGDRLDREPEPGREAHPDPELAREPEPQRASQRAMTADPSASGYVSFQGGLRSSGSFAEDALTSTSATRTVYTPFADNLGEGGPTGQQANPVFPQPAPKKSNASSVATPILQELLNADEATPPLLSAAQVAGM